MTAEHNENSLRDDIGFIGEEKSLYSNSNSKDDNELALKEDKGWDKLREDVDGENGLILEGVLFNIALLLIWLLTALFCVLLIIWFYHLVSPPCYRWLDNSNVQSIERILFASTLLSLAGKYFSKYKVLHKD